MRISLLLDLGGTVLERVICVYSIESGLVGKYVWLIIVISQIKNAVPSAQRLMLNLFLYNLYSQPLYQSMPPSPPAVIPFAAITSPAPSLK